MGFSNYFSNFGRCFVVPGLFVAHSDSCLLVDQLEAPLTPPTSAHQVSRREGRREGREQGMEGGMEEREERE